MILPADWSVELVVACHWLLWLIFSSRTFVENRTYKTFDLLRRRAAQEHYMTNSLNVSAGRRRSALTPPALRSEHGGVSLKTHLPLALSCALTPSLCVPVMWSPLSLHFISRSYSERKEKGHEDGRWIHLLCLSVSEGLLWM